MKPDCILCQQPITQPFVELWCPTCETYLIAHEGCKPGTLLGDGTLHKAMRREHKFIPAHALSICEVMQDVRRIRKGQPWDEDKHALSEMPIERPEYLRDATHQPGSTVGRRGMKVKP